MATSNQRVLLADTGIQYLCVPLSGSVKAFGDWRKGFHRTDANTVREYAFIRWRAAGQRLYLAVDTSSGPVSEGYFAAADNLAEDFRLVIDKLLPDPTKNPQDMISAPHGLVELIIRPSGLAGAPKAVEMVVDFGNSRTGALLVEASNDVGEMPAMLPFELVNRYHLHNAFDDEGELKSQAEGRWFSSKTHWCTPPFEEAGEIETKEYVEQEKSGLFGKKRVTVETSRKVKPRLFEDLSMVRMGHEADDVTLPMNADGDVRTGVSSPKRYLWGHDATWLDGANWHMADPHNWHGTSKQSEAPRYCTMLKGPLLRYVFEDDRDTLLERHMLEANQFAPEAPGKPQYPPRVLMTAAIYELLCQAYCHVNSLGYRKNTGDAGRARYIRSLSLTFPSGMLQEERLQFEQQTQKAVDIFFLTLGKRQASKPSVKFLIDEASAVHLTYIWGELYMLGQNIALWFDMVCRRPSKAIDGPTAGKSPAPARNVPPARPGLRSSEAGQPAVHPSNTVRELRIACIDIGGGTSDLMIARYEFEAGIVDSITGQVLHQDGISLAGDQLMKAMLEKIIVPRFVEAIRLDPERAKMFFGPEYNDNRKLRKRRVDWMNRMLVPLAQEYLRQAIVAGDEQDRAIHPKEIQHTDPELVSSEVLDSFEAAVIKELGEGQCNVRENLQLVYDKARFEGAVDEVLGDVLFDFCGRIIEHEADIVLLAGQPTKLKSVQELVRRFLPLPDSRVIPMDQHYAGNWYPYIGSAPGVITDPKSCVVVGAAIKLLADNGRLPQFRFRMLPRLVEDSRYYWGLINEQSFAIRDSQLIFRPDDTDNRRVFPVNSRLLRIGRKRSFNELSKASPAYLLKVLDPDEGKLDFQITLERRPAKEDQEERLELVAAKGTIGDQPAVKDVNVFFEWQTLASERYYLDTGGLDNIELEQV